jgi:hypothetical protein
LGHPMVTSVPYLQQSISLNGSYDLVVQMTAGDAFLTKIHWQNRILAT